MRCNRTRLAFLFVVAALAAPTLAHAVTITVEARCASGGSYVEGGTGWGNSNSKSNRTPCSNGSRSSKNAGAYADFVPPVTTPGVYDVYITWGATSSSNNGPNAENVAVALIDRDGTRNEVVNMRGHNSCAENNDQLIYLGRVYLEPGQGHKVRVSTSGSGQCYNGSNKRYVSADAVVFESIQPVPVAPTTWTKVKSRFAN
jgi:hypothetical protein